MSHALARNSERDLDVYFVSDFYMYPVEPVDACGEGESRRRVDVRVLSVEVAHVHGT